jgi:hypothetical protein
LKLFALLQIGFGYLHRTQAGRLDSSSGMTARQWTNPICTVEIQMMQAQAKRSASISTLDQTNSATGRAHQLLTSFASFLLRSTRAFNNQLLACSSRNTKKPKCTNTSCFQIP